MLPERIVGGGAFGEGFEDSIKFILHGPSWHKRIKQFKLFGEAVFSREWTTGRGRGPKS